MRPFFVTIPAAVSAGRKWSVEDVRILVFESLVVEPMTDALIRHIERAARRSDSRDTLLGDISRAKIRSLVRVGNQTVHSILDPGEVQDLIEDSMDGVDR